MVAGIEFGKYEAQVCVKTEQMKEPESLSVAVGTDGAEELFQKLLKLIKPHGNPEKLEALVFVLEENTAEHREKLLKLAKTAGISSKRVRFIDCKESFCIYVFHQPGELLTQHSLLIGNDGTKMSMMLLHRLAGTAPAVAEVRILSGETVEEALAPGGISSVFLVGDFEKEWMEHYLRLLKKGRRVFAGKNLYVKGACYRAMELAEAKTAERKTSYIYLGEETLRQSIALQGENDTLLYMAEAGKKWYEADKELDVLLLNGKELEFVLLPVGEREQTTVNVALEGLPKRPPKATKLRVSLEFQDTEHAHYTVRDLGFGELFPPTELVYEGELQWEQ